MAIELLGELTDLAREYRCLTNLSSFHYIISDFVVGERGHDPQNPFLARSVDTQAVVPNDGQPVVLGPKPLRAKRVVSAGCIRLDMRLERLEVVGPWSQIGILATITVSPTGTPAVGTRFLYALINRPYTTKTDSEEVDISVLIRGV